MADRLLAGGLPRDAVAEQRALALVERHLVGRSDEAITLGRYALLRCLGSGGGGRVYAAYDPQLERQVAIKLLHAQPGDSASERERTVREATALARLAHPNVVAVYDVGTFGEEEQLRLGLPRTEDTGLFIVMELVHGITLSEWRNVKERSWSEILAALVDVGRGLAAAHEQGVVHRDVKPANVLVGGDGRVRVADFGLARVADPGTSWESIDPRTRQSETHVENQPSALDPTSQRIAGTPSYMAPEQHRGEALDARADQFAYCVMAWELLVGQRPFTGKTLEQLETQKVAGPPPTPAETRLPGWLIAVLRRGLSPDPSDRFPSMSLLLGEIARAQHRSRRRWVAVAGGAALATVAGLALWPSPADVCARREALLSDVWDEARRASTRAALQRARQPYAMATWGTVEEIVDRYAERWVRVRTQVCQATFVEHAQSKALLEHREACLDVRLERLQDLLTALERASPEITNRAVIMAQTLPDPEECASSVPAGGSGPPEVRRELERALLRGTALAVAADYAAAIEVASDVADRAREVGWQRIEAEALLLKADATLERGEAAEAETLLRRALVLTEEAGDTDLGIRVLTEMVQCVGRVQGRLEEAELLAEVAGARLRRRGLDDLLDARLAYEIGSMRYTANRYDASFEHLQRALEIRRRHLAPDDTRLGSDLNGVGLVKLELGDTRGAREYLMGALEIFERKLGPEHPQSAVVMHNLALVDAAEGRFEDAMTHLERALASRIASFGEAHPSVASTLTLMGTQRTSQGRHAEALRLQQRAVAVVRSMAAPDPGLAGQVLGNCANALTAMEQPSEALALYGEVLELYDRRLSPTDPRRGYPLMNRGALYLRLGRPAEARTDVERAVEHFGSGSSAHRSYPVALAIMGEVQLALGEHEAGLDTLQRSLELRAEVLDFDAGAAHTALTLAGALRQEDPKRARALAEQARKTFERLGAEAERKTADALLDELGAGPD